MHLILVVCVLKNLAGRSRDFEVLPEKVCLHNKIHTRPRPSKIRKIYCKISVYINGLFDSKYKKYVNFAKFGQ